MINHNDFLEVTKFIGKAIPFWTQGQGGNVSIKTTNLKSIFIKPSGLRLDEITSLDDLLQINLINLKQEILLVLKNYEIKRNEEEAEKQYELLLQKYQSKEQKRPSMEMGFHALLPKQIVLHFHSLISILIGQYSIEFKDEFALWLKTFPDLKLSFIEITKPGFSLMPPLATEDISDIIILRKHGVILQGNDLNIFKQWQKIETSFCQYFKLNELLSLQQRNSSFTDLWDKFNQPIPLKIYFPDMAVFIPKLFEHLEPIEDLQFLAPSSLYAKEKNLAEYWLATVILFQNCKTLNEIPENLRSQICNLPSEKFRFDLTKTTET